MELKKIQIKVIDSKTDKMSWEHISYVSAELYDRFLKEMDCSREEFARYVAKWAYQDFNYKTTMAYKQDITILKSLVRERYRSIYPNIFIDGNTDRQGWMRTWLSKKMEAELKLE